MKKRDPYPSYSYMPQKQMHGNEAKKIPQRPQYNTPVKGFFECYLAGCYE